MSEALKNHWMSQGGEMFEYLVRILEAEGGSLDARVLDFGCGAGEQVLFMRGRGYDAYGFDVGGDTVTGARDLLEKHGFDPGCIQCLPDADPQQFYNIEKYSIPFPDKHFDMIFSLTVFEHIFNIEDTLEELHRILGDDGFIFTTFPSTYALVESHSGIPFTQWMPYSRFRERYIALYEMMGGGYATNIGAPAMNQSLRQYLCYRGHREMDRILSRYFTIRRIGYSEFSTYLWGTPRPPRNLKNRIRDIAYELFKNRNMILRKK